MHVIISIEKKTLQVLTLWRFSRSSESVEMRLRSLRHSEWFASCNDQQQTLRHSLTPTAIMSCFSVIATGSQALTGNSDLGELNDLLIIILPLQFFQFDKQCG